MQKEEMGDAPYIIVTGGGDDVDLTAEDSKYYINQVVAVEASTVKCQNRTGANITFGVTEYGKSLSSTGDFATGAEVVMNANTEFWGAWDKLSCASGVLQVWLKSKG
jgi:hypothetical protein